MAGLSIPCAARVGEWALSRAESGWLRDSLTFRITQTIHAHTTRTMQFIITIQIVLVDIYASTETKKKLLLLHLMFCFYEIL